MTINKTFKLAAIFLSLSTGLGAQTLSQAKAWFEKGEFEKAKPVFERLVRQSPSNASYNFWYGACCYETNEMKKGLPYLEKSAARKVINAFLYVSKAYYDLYRFDDAVENLEQHIYWLDKKRRDTSEAEALMAKYRKGERMLKSTSVITVIDSFTINKKNFLDAYKLGNQAGIVNLIKSNITPNDSIDIIDTQDTEFINEMGDKKLISQSVDNGYSKLYASVRLIDNWSNPQKLKGINDSESNLKFPYLNSDGTTLYFSSNGEESVGKYDIFITRSDSDENSYFKPDNIGFPFNSQYNDYMYAIDDYNNLGWFASDRFQPKDTVCVYVFVPNESGETYNFETEDPNTIISLAKLDNIALTQRNKDEVVKGKQRLAKIIYSNSKETVKNKDFTFIIDDNKTYHSLKDFGSVEAKELFQKFDRKKQDLTSLEKELEILREKYINSNQSTKSTMTPGMIDKEKRVEELRKEIETLSIKVRNTELRNNK